MMMRIHSVSLSAHRVLAILLVAAVLLWALPTASAQSLSYASGQNISPAYEGWQLNPDGTRDFVFGYMNRNWEEEIDVPVGPDNSFSHGADMGQPTHFLPRRNRFVFKVRVPSNFTAKDELVWTLTTHGKTEKAYATLLTDYELNDLVKASETGALGAGSSSPEVRANRPPSVTITETSRSVGVGQPLTLVAQVVDDGIPKRRMSGLSGAAVANEGSRRDTEGTAPNSANPIRPNRAMTPPTRVTVGKNVGLHLSWFVYRGAGKVTFTPEQVVAWEDTRSGANSPWAPLWTAPVMPADGKVTVQVTFSEPGTYVLRSLADDGALFGSDEITVIVKP